MICAECQKRIQRSIMMTVKKGYEGHISIRSSALNTSVKTKWTGLWFYVSQFTIWTFKIQLSNVSSCLPRQIFQKGFLKKFWWLPLLSTSSNSWSRNNSCHWLLDQLFQKSTWKKSETDNNLIWKWFLNSYSETEWKN